MAPAPVKPGRVSSEITAHYFLGIHRCKLIFIEQPQHLALCWHFLTAPCQEVQNIFQDTEFSLALSVNYQSLHKHLLITKCVPGWSARNCVGHWLPSLFLQLRPLPWASSTSIHLSTWPLQVDVTQANAGPMFKTELGPTPLNGT